MIRSTVSAMALSAALAMAGAAKAQSIEDRQWPLLMIGADAAAARGYTGEGVIVGVMDSGVQVDHPDLAANFSGLSFDPVTGAPALDDPDGHGTHVAGILAAARNGEGVRGVAYDAKFAVLRLSEVDSAEALDAVVRAGYDYALDRGVRLFSNSWGWDFYLGSESAAQMAREGMGEQIAGFRRAAAAGGLIVFSTGNESQAEPNVQAGLPYFVPELQAHWLAVTAVDRQGLIAPYANHCGLAAQWCLAAPGGAEPAAGQSAASSYIISTYPQDSYEGLTGTSMAAPHVTGAAAIARQMFPDAGAGELQRLILATASDLGAAGVDPVYGWGLLNIGNLARTRDAQTLSVFANTAWAADQALFVFTAGLDQRLWDSAGAGGWGAALAGRAEHDPGASTSFAEADTLGLSLGYDARTPAGDLLGVALGWSRTQMDEAGVSNSARIEAASIGLYGRLQRGPVFLAGSAALSQTDHQMRRGDIVGAAGTVLAGQGAEGRAATDGLSAKAQARVGLAFSTRLGELRPFVQAAILGQKIDAFAEDRADADIFALRLARTQAVRHAAGLGLQVALAPRPIAGMQVGADLAATYDVTGGDDHYPVQAWLLGAPIDGALPGLGDPVSIFGGLSAVLGAQTTASVRGYWSASSRSEASGLSLALKAAF